MHNLRTFLTLGLLILGAPLALHAQSAAPGKPVKITNVDFEQDLEGWKNAKSGASMVTIIPDGKDGKAVRVDDGDTTLNARLTSSKAPATAGKTYVALFDARSHGPAKGCGGFLAFYAQDGTRIEVPPGTEHHKDVTPDMKDWTQLKLSCAAPAGTVEVGVEIRSNKKSLVKADFDNFRVYEAP